MRNILIALFTLVGLVILGFALNRRSDVQLAVHPPQDESDQAIRQKEIRQANDNLLKCGKLIDRAVELQILRRRPEVGNIEAGPGFYELDFSTKEGLAKAISCYLNARAVSSSSGNLNSCVDFRVKDWRSGKEIGRFSNCGFEML
jgi:hypothetical protein